ncbi:MAG: hypothetical protein PHR25_05545 [Clostridia bacterium]|nr:hypothetical protein [Clostridia bacterium]
MKSRTRRISRRYPVITLIKILAIFNYQSGFVRNLGIRKEKLTIHKIGKILGIRSRELDKVVEALEEIGILTEVKSGKKRYLAIEDEVTHAIIEAKAIRNTLSQKVDDTHV